MYSAYDKIRSFLFRLMDMKMGAESKRLEYFSSFLSERRAESLLDLGCGKGLLFDHFEDSDKSRLFVGVDLTKEHGRNYEHIVADATRLPIRGSAFSFVTAFSLLEHIPQSRRDDFSEEARRIVNSHGTLTIQLPNRYFMIESHTFLPFFGFLPARMHSFAYRGSYVAVPSLKNVIGMLKKHRFQITRIQTYGGLFLPFGEFLSRIGLYRLFPMGYMIEAHPQNKCPESDGLRGGDNLVQQLVQQFLIQGVDACSVTLPIKKKIGLIWHSCTSAHSLN
jgi:ubiquinone/menaquinone biosynthesis C-methylase UbiE